MNIELFSKKDGNGDLGQNIRNSSIYIIYNSLNDRATNDKLKGFKNSRITVVYVITRIVYHFNAAS